MFTNVYLINRLPLSSLKGKTAHEYLYKVVLSLHHIRVFGYLAYSIEVRKVDKFTAKAIPTVFLGYSHLQKGYKLYAPSIKEFLINKDVVFKEDLFPFKNINDSFSLFSSDEVVYDSSNIASSPLVILTKSSSLFKVPSSVIIIDTAVHSSDAGSSAVAPNDVASIPIGRRTSTMYIKPSIWLKYYVTTSTKANFFVCILYLLI